MCTAVFIVYTRRNANKSLYWRHQKLTMGNTLTAPSPLPRGFFSLCSRALRHLLFVLLSFLLQRFPITEGLKETPNDSRRRVARWRECLRKRLHASHVPRLLGQQMLIRKRLHSSSHYLLHRNSCPPCSPLSRASL